MTLDRIHEECSNTFFCQVSKWGRDLNEEEAIKLGLLPAPSEKTPVKRTRKSKVSEPIPKEVIE